MGARDKCLNLICSLAILAASLAFSLRNGLWVLGHGVILQIRIEKHMRCQLFENINLFPGIVNVNNCITYRNISNISIIFRFLSFPSRWLNTFILVGLEVELVAFHHEHTFVFDWLDRMVISPVICGLGLRLFGAVKGNNTVDMLWILLYLWLIWWIFHLESNIIY